MPTRFLTMIQCAFCNKKSNHSVIQGMNGFFHCCMKCSEKFRTELYEHREHILGKLPVHRTYKEYCTECLKTWLHYNSWLYYLQMPEISDAEWDKGLRELQEREKIEGATPDSPTQSVGASTEEPKWPRVKKCKDCEEKQESKA